jgi:hypothetical protein
MADGTGFVSVTSLDEDQIAGRKPIGRNDKGELIFLNGDGLGVYR